MNFSSIPGLIEPKKMLTQAVRNHHLPHAQLFAGAEGALSLPMALALATYLHCETPTENEACGQCAACVKSLKYIHPDTHFVFPVSNVKADKDEERFKAEILKSWRAFLLESPFGDLDDWTNFYGGENKNALISREESREIVKALALKPFESKHKVMIIWHPETMHPSASNGILKILEEPPPETYFFLVTQAADRLLSTIISRTQMVTIPLLSDTEIMTFLQDHYSLKEDRCQKVAHLSNGNLHLAMRLSTHDENDNSPVFIEWMRACYKRNFDSMLTLAEDFHKLDKLTQRNLFAFSTNILRESLLHISGAEEAHRIQGEDLKFVKDFCKVLDLYKIEAAYQHINEASYHLERNGSAKMIFMDLSLKLAGTLNPN